MFDISALKEMKLPELQEIAKLAKTIKFYGVKKEELIKQILLHQSAANIDATAVPGDDKPKRMRITADKKPAIRSKNNTLFSEAEEMAPLQSAPVEEVKPESAMETVTPKPSKITKFKKADYEKKIAGKSEKQTSFETASESDTATEVAENPETDFPQKKINPNQTHKQNQNPNFNGNGNNGNVTAHQNGNGNGQNGNGPNGNQNPNFKTKKNNFRDADYEFDGIIESEGVLEMMPAMVSCVLLITITWLHPMIFIYRPRRSVCSA